MLRSDIIFAMCICYVETNYYCIVVNCKILLSCQVKAPKRKPRPVPHSRVLPRSKFNDTISQPLPVYFQSLTLYGHTKTAEQRTIIQQYSYWYTGR